MASDTRSSWCTFFTAGIGALDLLSGLALIFVPAQVLAVAGLESEDDLLLLSFVGAFVLAIGVVYLGAAWHWARRRAPSTLRAVWVSTAVVRLVVGSFVVAHVALDSFEPLWIWVGLADLTIAAIQLTGWWRGWIVGGENG